MSDCFQEVHSQVDEDSWYNSNSLYYLGQQNLHICKEIHQEPEKQ